MCVCMILLHCKQCLLQRNCPGYELFEPKLEYVLKEPSVDAEEELAEASQRLNSDGRQWTIADDGQTISNPYK